MDKIKIGCHSPTSDRASRGIYEDYPVCNYGYPYDIYLINVEYDIDVFPTTISYRGDPYRFGKK